MVRRLVLAAPPCHWFAASAGRWQYVGLSTHEKDEDEGVVVLHDHANNADDPSDPKGHMGGARLCNLTIQIVLPNHCHSGWKRARGDKS